jgi:DNA-directed RNA polymerase beta subunit
MDASEFYGQEDAPFVPVTTQADAWHVIKLYFKDKGLVRMQIDSFDKFLFEQIPSFISETKGQLRMETNNTTSHANMHIKKKEVTIEMSDIKLHRPSQSTPMECRLRGHTYEGAVMVCLAPAPFCVAVHVNILQVSITKRERSKLRDDTGREYWPENWSQSQERLTLCRIPTMLKSKVLHPVVSSFSSHGKVFESPSL